jgi:hypothetical protein
MEATMQPQQTNPSEGRSRKRRGGSWKPALVHEPVSPLQNDTRLRPMSSMGLLDDGGVMFASREEVMRSRRLGAPGELTWKRKAVRYGAATVSNCHGVQRLLRRLRRCAR